MLEFITSFVQWLQLHPHISGPVFVTVFAAVMAVGIPGGLILTLSAGLLFGTLTGGLLATIGVTLGAMATHGLVRTAFGRWLDKRALSERYSIRSFLESDNTLLLVLPRLLVVIPFFVINIGLTAAGVPLRTYLWTTVAGLLPVSFLFARIGSEFRNLQQISQTSLAAVLLSPGLLVPLFLLILMTLLGWLYIKRRAGLGSKQK